MNDRWMWNNMGKMVTWIHKDSGEIPYETLGMLTALQSVDVSRNTMFYKLGDEYLSDVVIWNC